MEKSSGKGNQNCTVHSYPISSPIAAKLRDKLLSQKKKIAEALQPQLSSRIEQLIKRKYNRVLQKVEITRNQLQKQGISLKNTDSVQFFKDREQVKKFYQCLNKQMHDLIPELMNQIAFKISRCLSKASQSNLIAKTIRLYPSLMGAYMYRPTLRQMLTPTVRTLHHLEQQMLDNYSEARGTQNSLWVLMYLVSAMFVHLFGKYITPFEKLVVNRMVRQTFVVSVIYVATGLEVSGLQEQGIQSEIQKWFIELKYLSGSGMASL